VTSIQAPPLCIGCASTEDSAKRDRDGLALPRQWPCVNCGRQLRHLCRHRFAETFCSEECEDAVYARRERRRQRRERFRDGMIFCICCGVRFQPKRRGDAMTCNCRQRGAGPRVVILA
jgi:hypothetical protein